MSELLDDEGNIYQKGIFGEWQQKQGMLGATKATDLFGRPKIKRNLLGQPEEARTFMGGSIRGQDGRTLYHPHTPASTGLGSETDAMAGCLGLILGAAIFLAVGAVLYLTYRLLEAFLDAWRESYRRYPRAMLGIHLTFGMLLMGFGMRLAGFPWQAQIASALLVLGLWGWLWLTRHQPMVFMPVNATLLGGGLWVGASLTEQAWLTQWSRFTAGLPLLPNLPILLAALPLGIWLWSLGASRKPRIFQVLSLLIAGAILWFLSMRVWTNWLPTWEAWMRPVPPLLSITGWMIFLLPMALWFWLHGQSRWPYPFMALNLLLFGGLLGLAAYNTQPRWIETWHNWTEGLPFAQIPILAISIAPVTMWSWSTAGRRFPKVFLFPNLVLTGGVLWLALDRTRTIWTPAWKAIWGDVPLDVDPVLLVPIIPFFVWAWRKGRDTWPDHWRAARSLLWGAILWWIAERYRTLWDVPWSRLPRGMVPDFAILIGLAPSTTWVWIQARKKWPRFARVAGALLASGLVFWISGFLIPDTPTAARLGMSMLPIVVLGWSVLVRRKPKLGWALVLCSVAPLSLFAWWKADDLGTWIRSALEDVSESPVAFDSTTPPRSAAAIPVATQPVASLPALVDESAPDCLSWNQVSLDQVGGEVCVSGSVYASYAAEGATFVVFDIEEGSFFLLSYDQDLSRLSSETCISVEGKVEQLGQSPVIVLGTRDEIADCP